MQTSSELTKIEKAKAAIKELLNVAIACHEHHEQARQSVQEEQQAALEWAWKSGKALNEIKPRIGHSNWTPWLSANWLSKRQHRSVRSAQCYMKIDADNPNAQRVADLKFDTIRKYAIGFVPEKDKPPLKGNVTFARLSCDLKFVNEWHRWKRRRDTGQIDKNLEEERRNCREMFDWMSTELYGDDE
jgi:hypothetical protein